MTVQTKSTNFKAAALLRTALAGAALFSFSALTTANAQTIGPLTTSTPISHITELVGAPTDTLEFTTFDSNLGTLISVVLHVDAGISSVVTVMNSALTPSHGSVFTQSQYSVTDPLANSLLSPTVNTTSFVYNLAPGQSVTSPALLGSIGATGTFTDAPTLSQFTTNGAGSIYLPVTTNTITFTANTGGNTASGQVTTANATGTVTYNYISNGNVPEPGALALISAGAVSGFFIIRRRRRK